MDLMQPRFKALVTGIACVVSSLATQAQLSIKIDGTQKAQVIDNIGASGCWFSEGIGKNWPAEKRERIAQLLFSQQLDKAGNPEGIGLSCWRFNIGGGTAEQGDSSGMNDFRKRVECFLSPDGTYDWSKQAGYMWFVKKAKSYGVEKLIAFSNTPPVQFTQNGLGYKTSKDYKSNLQADKYDDYAGFLAAVLQHFDQEGVHFDMVSPVNEPQWDWMKTYGSASQEGSPWRNEEIYKVVAALDSSLSSKKLATQILMPEVAHLEYMYAGSGGANQQLQHLYATNSPLNVTHFEHVPNVIAGHSYFTDGSKLTEIRAKVATETAKYNVDYWESEYSMLGDSYKEGKKGPVPAMDCALFLSKVIYSDIVVGNAHAWQLWNAYEPGPADHDTRYYLIALDPNKAYTDGNFTPVKNLWALGHYSRFIRPGAQRLQLDRSDHATAEQAVAGTMVSAYLNTDGKLAIVATNYTTQPQTIELDMENLGRRKKYTQYLTTAAPTDNMRAIPGKLSSKGIALPARSISTIVFE